MIAYGFCKEARELFNETCPDNGKIVDYKPDVCEYDAKYHIGYLQIQGQGHDCSSLILTTAYQLPFKYTEQKTNLPKVGVWNSFVTLLRYMYYTGKNTCYFTWYDKMSDDVKKLFQTYGIKVLYETKSTRSTFPRSKYICLLEVKPENQGYTIYKKSELKNQWDFTTDPYIKLYYTK